GRQIFLEARWLVFYSAHWDRMARRLRELRELLARPADPPDAREQLEADGSYDHCSEAWFLKLDSTIEEVEDRGARGEKPKFPLKLLDRINNPELLRAYLDSLLISEVRKTGIDNRFELNIAITAIERFIAGHVGKVYDFHPDLERALFDYQDNHWQDPETGSFGGWYRRADGSVRKTADLSITFHIASYRRDSIKRIPEMMRTTLDFKDQEYPFGWREEGAPSNHHNYDVVRLFRLGWPRMNAQQRDIARAEMRRMMEFCLRDTMNPEGSSGCEADATARATWSLLRKCWFCIFVANSLLHLDVPELDVAEGDLAVVALERQATAFGFRKQGHLRELALRDARLEILAAQ